MRGIVHQVGFWTKEKPKPLGPRVPKKSKIQRELLQADSTPPEDSNAMIGGTENGSGDTPDFPLGDKKKQDETSKDRTTFPRRGGLSNLYQGPNQKRHASLGRRIGTGSQRRIITRGQIRFMSCKRVNGGTSESTQGKKGGLGKGRRDGGGGIQWESDIGSGNALR